GPNRPPAAAMMSGWSAESPPAPFPTPPQGVQDDPLLRREVSLSFPRKAEAGRSRDETPLQSILAAGGEWPPSWVTLGEVAEALHNSAGVDVLADSFVRARLAPEKLAGK